MNLVGQKFGRLTVLKRAGSTAQQKALWSCSCDCGGVTTVTTGALRSGSTRSCGCLQRTSSKRSGPSRRKIDYSAVSCHKCGKSLSKRFIGSDGLLKRVLCKNRLDRLACKKCHTGISKLNGRIPSERNSSIPFTKVHEDVVIGSILGDGSFEMSTVGKNPNWGLAVKHGLKQENYCLWKAYLLRSLLSKIDYPSERVRFRTVKHKAISKTALKMTNNGKKAVNEQIVSKMGPLGFAIWYLDDGNLLPYRISKIGKTKKPEIRFSTNSFTEEENLILRRVLEKRIRVKTTKCQWIARRSFNGAELSEPKRFYGIRLYGENVEKFLAFIFPHVDWEVSGMAYKADTSLRGPLNNKHTRRRSPAA